MRYIITQSQLHSVVYKFLNKMFEGSQIFKNQNPYNEKAYRLTLHTSDGDEKIEYFYFGEGEDDDGNIHYGVGMLHIHPDIVYTLRQLINIRESKVVDIVADWFSEKFEVDIDETSIYPNRKKPPIY